MITSIFSKSKPINFILVFFITAIAFVMAALKLVKEPFTIALLLKQLVLFFVCYSSILLLNFMVSKNGLTKNNNYEILLYSLFLLALLETTQDTNIVIANFFLLLGLRRILSIRTQLKLNKKLFDAAFWIAIASLFYFWAILFFVLIILALVLYTDNKLNHWLIPFSGVLTVFIFTVCYSIICFGNYFEAFINTPSISYAFDHYNLPELWVAITLLFSFGIWSTLFYIKSIKMKKKALRPSFHLILITFLISFLIVVLAPKKNSAEFLFMFAPLAIIMTNYIEVIEEKWFKELFLMVFFVVPFLLLLL
ncbi:DUF6427 family protein [Aestuariivivens sediminis]|uniref:DUF6427 family protein n=1 Tax=Aestuariivivens sediminis TaxID=2913557 RepID=UPI001F59FCAE|nr:DUF6427 family protein [Aestuariivivens sediminis]